MAIAGAIETVKSGQLGPASSGTCDGYAARMIRVFRIPQVSNPAGESNPRYPWGLPVGVHLRASASEPRASKNKEPHSGWRAEAGRPTLPDNPRSACS
jgi:hypothetical protein